MSALLYHMFDSEDLALARQAEIDAASGFPCYVQGYTFPEGEPVPVWTEHAESVRAKPDGTAWAIAAVDLAELAPVEAVEGPAIDTTAPALRGPVDLGGGKSGELGGGVIKVPAAPEPVALAEPIELDDSWNGLPKT